MGLMMLGDIPTRTIAAMYAEAPAWPTEEYNNAAKKNNKPSSKICCKSKGHAFNLNNVSNYLVNQRNTLINYFLLHKL